MDSSLLKEKVFSISQQTDHFIALFNKKKIDIENNLLKAEQMEKDKLAAHFDLISEDIQKMQKYLNDSTIFLPYYNIKVAQETIKHLQDQTILAREKLMPKKKFAFKKKTFHTSTKSATNDSVDTPKIATDHLRKEILNSDIDNGFRDKKNDNLELQENVNCKDAELAKLENCIVKIYATPNTLHISDLKNCQVFVGPVTTSIFIENCVDCVFVVACQQLRVHSTSSSDFYLHVTSRAIIEDSVNLRFAPYNWTYENLDRHFEASGLDKSKNNWHLIDDFNWLSAETPSPNWSVMDESCRNNHIN